MRDELREFPAGSPSEKDSDVLDIITQEALLKFTFDGLKRRLGMHPETLSRILNRLEQGGFLKKSSEGYTVTSKIQDYSSPKLMVGNKNQISLLQTFIPTNVSAKQLVQDLRGKWFGMLRWMGFAQNEGVVTLKWITEDSTIQVNASICESTLTITAKFLQENDMDTALAASYQLITHISRICQRKHIFQHVGYIGNYGFYHMPA
jgi:hypothetical protein